MRQLLKISFFLLCFAPFIAHAIVVKSLYQVEVPVASQTKKVRSKAFPQALEQVFIKLTGNPAIGTIPQIRHHLKNAAEWVEQYRYSTQPNQQVVLHVTFQQQAIRQLLVKARQAIWGVNRPSLLMWVAESSSDGQQLLNDNSPVIQQLRVDAKARGLPIMLPLLDLQDINRLTFNDVWTGLTMPVLAASKRYASDAVVMVKLDEISADQWQSEWTLLIEDNKKLSWTESANSLDAVLKKGINDISAAIARRYAVLAGGERSVQVSVDNIDDLTAYAKTMAYLRSLTPVKKVQVNTVDANQVIFTVEYRGGKQSLQQAIGLNTVIKLEKSEPSEEGKLSSDMLRYSLS